MTLTHSTRLFFRNLRRRKLFSLINIAGLAFSIGFIILIGQYVYFEYSHNSSLPNVERIYRITNQEAMGSRLDHSIAQKVADEIPGVKHAGIMNITSVKINRAGQHFSFDKMALVDQAFFRIFDFPFVYGDAESALGTVDGIALTESAAKQIFGKTDVLGETLLLNHQLEMVVTGIIKDLPDNISIQASMFISAENSFQNRVQTGKTCINRNGISNCMYPFDIFLELEPRAEPLTITEKIAGFYEPGNDIYPEKPQLLPFKTNYFETSIQYDYNLQHGNARLINILLWIGLIIIGLAVINYINLTTAAYKYRLTEIGLKKCFGASRPALQKQLLFESLLFCLSAAILGIVIAEIFLPVFSEYVQKPLKIEVFSNPQFALMFIVFISLLSLFSGLVPAVILSKITPLQIFKLNAYLKGSGKYYRQALSVFQFGATITLIACLLVMIKQIDYVKHKDLGFNTTQLLYLNIHPLLNEKIQPLADKLREYHGTESLTVTGGIPSRVGVSINKNWMINADSATVSTFGFRLIDGRTFLSGDEGKSVIINETSLKDFENGEWRGQKLEEFEIVGVVSDFHFRSLHRLNAPLALLLGESTSFSQAKYVTLRLSGNISQGIDFIRQTWQEINPDFPLDFEFYDERFAGMYREQERLATLIGMFAVLAIIISCLGIFGLAVFQAEQRVKEIGIRKVLGATVPEITAMLTTDFTKWVILANIIAWPVAWYAASRWLQDFAYRIELNWWVFAIVGLLAVGLAFLTVSTQAVKAAISNPVDTLKSE
ncbi:MAG: ABC transporter permease [Calditrichaeota bacterium]|nr:ABC transporter permease [Calditrichota bacterium]